jgi:hypothetical protein
MGKSVPPEPWKTHIRESAEQAVKFFAANNVLTGALDNAFTRFSKKLLNR